jgi:hypothetical protein
MDDARTGVVVVDHGQVARVTAAPGCEQAADTLIEYVEKSTGARLQLLDRALPAGDGDGPALIHLGISEFVCRSAPELADLDEDGFVIRTVDSVNLVVAGPSHWGTEHGVSEFLERCAGVRWLLPGAAGEHVPSLERLVIQPTNVVQEPAFGSRVQVGLRSAPQQEWGRRLRLRGRHAGASHSIRPLLPPDTYRGTRPEIYPVAGGQRLVPPADSLWKWHPRFSAPGLAEEAASNIRRFFREHPDERWYSIAVNDGPVACEMELGAPMWGSVHSNWLGNRHASEHFFRWANRVAELVVEEFPDHWLGCLGYTNTFQAPAEVKVHPRIVVFHCYDRHKWIHPELRRQGHCLAQDWREACPNMAWYDYTFGCSFMAPRVYFHHMGDYLRYARDLGLVAMLGETCHNWAEAPKYYVQAKLYWNPDEDVDALLDEWYRLAVGVDAAAALAAYYRHWELFWTERLLDSSAFSLKGQQWLPIQDDTYFDVLQEDDFSRSRELLEETQARAGSEAQQARAQLLMRGFEYYEASAQARLPDYRAGGCGPGASATATELVEAAVTASAAAARRYAIDSRLDQDPVLARTIVSWPATERSDWGVYSLWRNLDIAAASAALRQRLQELSGCGDDVLAAHAGLMLRILAGTAQPLAGARLGAQPARVQTVTVRDDTPLSIEPGDRMPLDTWYLTVGDDVVPFWNGARNRRGGSLQHADADGRTSGKVVAQGVRFGTVRRKYLPAAGTFTGLCFVRLPKAAAGTPKVVLNLWEITLWEHNPSPFRTVVWPQPDEWIPVAVTGRVRPDGPDVHRALDYLLLELAVEGLEDDECLEIADMALYSQDA